MNIFNRVFFLLVAIAFVRLGPSEFLRAQDREKEASQESRPTLRYTISKDSTYFTGPLNEDGSLDFVAAVNERFAQGVTTENNAARIIVPILDKWDWGGDDRVERIMKAMGLTPGDVIDSPKFMYLRTFSQAPGGEKLETVDAACRKAYGQLWTDDEQPLMRRWLDVNNEALSLIADASRRERYYVPLVPTEKSESLGRIALEHVQGIKHVAEAFIIRANNHMGHQRWNEAWADILVVKELGRLVGQGQCGVEGMVGNSLTGKACNKAIEFIALAPLEAVDWEELRSQWHIRPVADIVRSAGVTDRAMLIQLACSIADQPEPNAELLQDIWMTIDERRSYDNKAVGNALQKLTHEGKIQLDDTLRIANQMYDQAIQILSIDDATARNTSLDEIHQKIGVSRSAAPGEKPSEAVVRQLISSTAAQDELFAKVLLEMAIPAIQADLRPEMRVRASQQVVDLALVARAMQTRNKRLPESLADLEPFVEKETLIQPSTGDAIGFRADDSGIVIYHWHTNRQDDGGDLESNEDDWGIRIKK